MKNRYGYEELKTAAIKHNSTAENRLALLAWFDNYGYEYWNGNKYLLEEDGLALRPVLKGVGEPDEDGEYAQYEAVDAEICY